MATGDYAGAYEISGNDVYRLERETRGQVILTTSNGMDACPVGTDTTLTLFHFRDGVIGDTVNQNGDGGPGACSSINTQLEPGSYIAVVAGFLGGRSDGYTLSARFIDIEPNFRPIRIENAGVDAPSARFRATCADTGAECFAEGTNADRGRCEIHCPITSQVELCCGSGSGVCGGTPILSQEIDAALDANGLEMYMCPVQASAVALCRGIVDEAAVEARCVFTE